MNRRRRDRGHLRRRGRDQALHQQRRLHRCPGRFHVQAVRAGGGHAGRHARPDRAREQTRTRTPVSPKSVYNGDNKVKLRNYDGTVWHDKDGKEWHQSNDGDESRGRITLRTAMQYSVNTPFIQLGMDVGIDKVRQAALDAGLTEDSLARPTPTFSLGTSQPSAIRMANAYGTFATSGTQRRSRTRSPRSS